MLPAVGKQQPGAPYVTFVNVVVETYLSRLCCTVTVPETVLDAPAPVTVSPAPSDVTVWSQIFALLPPRSTVPVR